MMYKKLHLSLASILAGFSLSSNNALAEDNALVEACTGNNCKYDIRCVNQDIFDSQKNRIILSRIAACDATGMNITDIHASPTHDIVRQTAESHVLKTATDTFYCVRVIRCASTYGMLPDNPYIGELAFRATAFDNRDSQPTIQAAAGQLWHRLFQGFLKN